MYLHQASIQEFSTFEASIKENPRPTFTPVFYDISLLIFMTYPC